jgi:hypothetical protein
MLEDKLWSSVWAPEPLTAAVDSLGMVTIGVLALTERFSTVPAAAVAFVAAHLIASYDGTD